MSCRSPSPPMRSCRCARSGPPACRRRARRRAGPGARAACGLGARKPRARALGARAREGSRAAAHAPLGPWPAPDAVPHSLWLPQRLRRAGLIESFEDVTGEPWNPLSPLPSGTRALTLQNACAFRAYAELRLGASEPEGAEPGVPMDQRGLLLHAALQGLWERLRDSRQLAALDAGALAGAHRRVASRGPRRPSRPSRTRSAAARAHGAESQLDFFATLPVALVRECRRAEALIARLCELERTRAPFTVLATEAVQELALGGGRVRMRLDRIDRTADGRIVLDYKSGRAGSPDWYGRAPDASAAARLPRRPGRGRRRARHRQRHGARSALLRRGRGRGALAARARALPRRQRAMPPRPGASSANRGACSSRASSAPSWPARRASIRHPAPATTVT